MKKSILIPILAFAAASCQKETTKEIILDQKNYGHEQGNGTDNPPSDFADAWMTGLENTIKYCAVISSDFGVDENTVKTDLQNAFLQWKNYIILKNINQDLKESYLNTLTHSHPEGIPPYLSDKADGFMLSTESQLLSSCNGTENIKFYFGVEDAMVTAIKSTYYNPTAFAHRIDYNPKTGVGRGFVWLNKAHGLGQGKYGPDWSLPYRVLGVLLHEIGHIYGIRHLENTIMQEDMYGLLLPSHQTSVDQEILEYKLQHIDHNAELYFTDGSKNETRYEGRMSYFKWLPEDAAIEAGINFKNLTGVDPVGPVSAQLYKNKYSISDGSNSYEFDLSLSMYQHYASNFIPVFSVNRLWDSNGIDAQVGAGLSLGHKAYYTLGEIESKTGEKFPVLLERNFGSPVRLHYLINGEQKALLVMASWF